MRRLDRIGEGVGMKEKWIVGSTAFDDRAAAEAYAAREGKTVELYRRVEE